MATVSTSRLVPTLSGEIFSASYCAARRFVDQRSFVSRSFRGTDIHGTSLPLLKRKIRGGEGDGGGDGDPYIYTLHKAKTEKNVNAAMKYATVRAARNAVAKFWQELAT